MNGLSLDSFLKFTSWMDVRSRSTTLFQLVPEICSGVKVRTFLGATGVNVWFSIIKMAQSRHHSSLPLRWIDGTAVYILRGWLEISPLQPPRVAILCTKWPTVGHKSLCSIGAGIY